MARPVVRLYIRGRIASGRQIVEAWVESGGCTRASLPTLVNPAEAELRALLPRLRAEWRRHVAARRACRAESFKLDNSWQHSAVRRRRAY